VLRRSDGMAVARPHSWRLSSLRVYILVVCMGRLHCLECCAEGAGASPVSMPDRIPTLEEPRKKGCDAPAIPLGATVLPQHLTAP
jgi:hypothetical protein